MKITALDILGVVLVILRVLEVIEWSWWWVLAPFWIQIPVGLAGFLTLLVLLHLRNR